MNIQRITTADTRQQPRKIAGQQCVNAFRMNHRKLRANASLKVPCLRHWHSPTRYRGARRIYSSPPDGPVMAIGSSSRAPNSLDGERVVLIPATSDSGWKKVRSRVKVNRKVLTRESCRVRRVSAKTCCWRPPPCAFFYLSVRAAPARSRRPARRGVPFSFRRKQK